MASKNDTRHGIDSSVLGKPDVMSGIVFDAMFGVKKLTNLTPAVTYPTSANEASVLGLQVKVV